MVQGPSASGKVSEDENMTLIVTYIINYTNII